MTKEDKYMYARIIAFAIVQIIWIVSLFGVKVPVVNQNDLTEAIYAILDLIFMGYMIWKNHNFTDAAKVAQTVLDEHKSYKTDFEKELKQEGIEISESEELPDGIGATYTPRLTAPSATDKNWIYYQRGGYNECIIITGNSCIPNCVGYAWGRARELMGKAPKLSKGNADKWYGYSDGYPRSKTVPRLGSIICWQGGSCGHVGVVEQIAADGTITVSQSAYGGTRFYLTKLKKPYNVGKFVLQGFIYLPIDTESDSTKDAVSTKAKDKKQYLEITSYRNVYSDVKKSKLITKIPKGAKVYTTKVNGKWLYVPAYSGWIYETDSKIGKCVKTVKSFAAKYKALDTMNIRELPTASSGKAGSLKKGVTFEARDTDGSWVYYPGKGWICTKEGKEIYLQKTK